MYCALKLIPADDYGQPTSPVASLSQEDGQLIITVLQRAANRADSEAEDADARGDYDRALMLVGYSRACRGLADRFAATLAATGWEV